MEGWKEVKLTANPNADALCLKKDTAVGGYRGTEREELIQVQLNYVYFSS